MAVRPAPGPSQCPRIAFDRPALPERQELCVVLNSFHSQAH